MSNPLRPRTLAIAAAALAFLLPGAMAAPAQAEIGLLAGPKSFRVNANLSYLMRHADFIGRVTPYVGPREDFIFDVEQYRSTTMDPMRSDRYFPRSNLVRLRSRNFPGRYLRHKFFRLVLDEPGDPNFDNDSLFYVERGLDGSGTWITAGDWKDTPSSWSFRSYNFPDRFIHARMSEAFRLWLDQPSGASFARESTFSPSPASG